MDDMHPVGTYRIADIVIRVESLYTSVQELCQSYRCDEEPELVVRTSQADIDFERARSDAADAAAGRAVRAYTDGYLETLAVYRQVAEAIPARDMVLVHGSCVAVDGAAYLFCAPSGTGKSTHVRLWRELLGERAIMVNDDKPIVRLTQDQVIVYGTPWDGKHRLSSNIAVPLRAICLLGRDETNHIEQTSAKDAYSALLRQVYRPLDTAALIHTLALVDSLAERVGLWRMGCNIDIEAAKVSFAAMSGEIGALDD